MAIEGVEATRTNEGEIGVGTAFGQVSAFFGRRIESTFEVTEFRPRQRIRYESTSGTFPIRATREVEPQTDGTVVGATIEGEPGGFISPAAPVLGRITKSRIQGDFAVLKALFESGRS